MLEPEATQATTADTEADKTVLLHEEFLDISRRRVRRDTVQVKTITTEYEHRVEESLTHERVEVRRILIDRVVEIVPDTRQEGDVTIIPVVEEQTVIQRRLVLKEEVHLQRKAVSDVHKETVVLRKQEAIVSRIPASLPADGSSMEDSSNQ